MYYHYYFTKDLNCFKEEKTAYNMQPADRSALYLTSADSFGKVLAITF